MHHAAWLAVLVVGLHLVSSKGTSHLLRTDDYRTDHVPRVVVRTHPDDHRKCCTDHRIGQRRIDDCVQTPFHGHLVRPDEVRRGAVQQASYDCTISEKYKFVFPHIYKSGGSSLKNWFISVLCDGVEKKKGRFHPTANQACLGKVLRHGSCKELGRHPDFFTFVFVRHPVNRSISQYAMATAPKFWKGNATRPPLETFVRTPHKFMKDSRLSTVHIRPQYDFVFSHSGCPVVDFVGHLETYNRDFYYILTKLNATALWEGFERYSFHGHRGDDPNVFGSKLRREHADLIAYTPEMEDILYHRQPRDFDMLGYERIFDSPDPNPETQSADRA